MTYYKVKWREPQTGRWIESWGPLNEVEARKYLAKDIDYFYSDIQIQLVKINEEVIETHQGTSKRRGGVG